jgi:hypothetical protein
MIREVWALDCTSEVNVSIKIDGQTFPIQPLDLNQHGHDNSGNNIYFGIVGVEFLKSPVRFMLTNEAIESSKQSSLGLKIQHLTGPWEWPFVTFLSYFCPSVRSLNPCTLFVLSLVSNMYILLNYGDFIYESTSNMANPYVQYVQFISTTDPATALAEFVAVRLGGKDTTGSQHISSPNNGVGSGSS